jgi:hypothetical protein
MVAAQTPGRADLHTMPPAARLLWCLLAGLQLSQHVRMCEANAMVLSESKIATCVDQGTIKCGKKMVVVVSVGVRAL